MAKDRRFSPMRRNGAELSTRRLDVIPVAFPFNSQRYSFPSRRRLVFGKNGMVAASNPLAAGAGIEVLKAGGNAVDAALAAAAVLTVVEPTSNGLGGDAFALVHTGGKLYGLNSSGPCPAGLTAQTLRDEGHSSVPARGLAPITVPGVPAAWGALSKKFGRLPLADVLRPAVRYARGGFPLQPKVAQLWKAAQELFSALARENGLFAPWLQTFGLAEAEPGELVTLKDHAETLEEIGRTGGESFYRGELARQIGSFVRSSGGWLSAEDLAAFSPEWVEPLSVPYRNYQIFELPPNGHGLTVLLALNILRGFEPTRDRELFLHQTVEAMKLAFADAKAYIADPRQADVPLAELLSEGYAERRRALIRNRAELPCPGSPRCGGTVYLASADGDGNMVSYIQSNYMGFGSGVVVPGTGIALHNRGANFSLDPASPNCLAPGKRPYHTIIPGFLCRDGQPFGPFGVMGAFMQPQGHVQVVSSLADDGLNPQEALDRPRWQWTGGLSLELEQTFPNDLALSLKDRGHQVTVSADDTSFGRGQVILRDGSGVLCGATEPRTDGAVAVW